MAKSKAPALKKQILARFPKGTSIKKERYQERPDRMQTRVTIVTSSGTAIKSLSALDYEIALVNLEFATRKI